MTEIWIRFRCPDDHGPSIEDRAIALDPTNAVAWYNLGTGWSPSDWNT